VAGHANDAITVVTPNTEQLNSSLTLGFINCALKLSKENILGLLGSLKREVRRIHFYMAEKEKTNDTKVIKDQT
jgi:hypothetical protein